MAMIGQWIQKNEDDYKRWGTGKGTVGNKDFAVLGKTASRFSQTRTKAKDYSNLERMLSQMFYGKDSKTNNYEQQFWNKVTQEFQKAYPYFGVGTSGGVYKLNKEQISNLNVTQLHNLAHKLMINLQNKINSSKDLREDEIKKIGEQIKKLEDATQNAMKEVKNGTRKVSSSNLIEQVNQALGMASLPYSLATGEFWEMYLGRFSKHLDLVAETAVDQLLERTMRGKNTKMQGKQTDTMSKPDDFKVGSVTFKAITSQQKTDIIMTYDDQDLNISAKNYSLRDKDQMIHIVSGSPFYSFVTGENSNEFVNHWLNCLHLRTSNLPIAHRAMKTMIMYKALTGARAGITNTANVFILNSRSHQRIYIRDMASIQRKVYQNINLLNIVGYPDQGIKLNNSGYMSREADAIKFFHSTKLSASLDRKAVI